MHFIISGHDEYTIILKDVSVSMERDGLMKASRGNRGYLLKDAQVNKNKGKKLNIHGSEKLNRMVTNDIIF
jgi:Mg-chelatase subunit ChlD